MNLYRVFPVLWNDGICKQAATVYGIDRVPSGGAIPTACSSRVREDPAYHWASSTFYRLLPPPDVVVGCCNGSVAAAVTWETLPAWLSSVQMQGYTVEGDLSRMKPYSDIYIRGP